MAGNGNDVSKADEIDELLQRVLHLVTDQRSHMTAHLIEMAIFNQRKLAAKRRQGGCHD